jgi:hypothetical protein
MNGNVGRERLGRKSAHHNVSLSRNMVREGNVVEMFVNHCRHRLYVSPKSEYQRQHFDKIEAEYEPRKMQEDKQILTTFGLLVKK